MAGAAAPPLALKRLSGALPGSRMVEWGILAVLVVVVLGVLGHYVRTIQGQTERAAVVATLGGLRTALVIDHLHQVTTRTTGVSPSSNANPFLVLQTLPLNYRGEVTLTQALEAPPGSWVFDPHCRCVGYLPLDTAWHSVSEGVSILWFRVGEGPGVRGLTSQAHYVWQGLEIR